MVNVLSRIVEHKKNVVANSADYTNLSLSQKDFKAALNQNTFAFIMECKKASPSRGLIRDDFDLDFIVGVYEQYADAISVLTEEKFFQGSFSYLEKVAKNTSKPVLCKDFIFTEKQIRQARHFGADAVLLMMSVVNDEEYLKCSQQAKQLNMDVLTEVHTEQELKRALSLGAEIIGINNRNLKTLETDLTVTKKLAEKVPESCILVTESGISSHKDIIELSPFADAALVGSSLMSQLDLEVAAKKMVFGDIKICGVTRQSDSDFLQKTPCIKIGAIFAESSKRTVQSAVDSYLPVVAVFQNQSLDFVIHCMKKNNLTHTQLHGNEDIDYIQKLKAALPDVHCSKTIHIDVDATENDCKVLDDIISPELLSVADEILLDSQSGTQQGGTGEKFNPKILNLPWLLENQYKIRVAGGLGADDILPLKAMGYSLFDFCSSTELSPGIKSESKILNIFNLAKLPARSAA